MGNLATGALMVFFVVILNAVVAFMVSGATPSAATVGCDSNEDANTTTCGTGSPQGFLATFFDVAVSGFSDAAVIDGFYVLLVVGVLVIGLALIVAGFIGIPFGGG